MQHLELHAVPRPALPASARRVRRDSVPDRRPRQNVRDRHAGEHAIRSATMIEIAVTDDERVELAHAAMAQIRQHGEFAGIAARRERRPRVVDEHVRLRAHDDGEPLPHIQHRQLEITDTGTWHAMERNRQAQQYAREPRRPDARRDEQQHADDQRDERQQPAAAESATAPVGTAPAIAGAATSTATAAPAVPAPIRRPATTPTRHSAPSSTVGTISSVNSGIATTFASGEISDTLPNACEQQRHEPDRDRRSGRA